jgi:hypothetical protein
MSIDYSDEPGWPAKSTRVYLLHVYEDLLPHWVRVKHERIGEKLREERAAALLRRQRAWQERNREHCREYQRRYRAKKKAERAA